MGKAGGQRWYAEGVRFQCQWPACVACCTGEPGYVWLSREEIAALAARYGIEPAEFLRDYTIDVDGRTSLAEKADGSGDCVLLADGGCSAYEARPAQCRSYPFWPEVMHSRRAWTKEGAYCPGIGQGPVIPADEIDRRRQEMPVQRPTEQQHIAMQQVRAALIRQARDNARREAREAAARERTGDGESDQSDGAPS